MFSSRKENQKGKETYRLEAFSDGVFAIAITLLILEIRIPSGAELREGLLTALLNKWASYLAFVIGFFSVLVCWINHRHVFNHIVHCTNKLCIINALVLLVVTFVPFPTAILAGFIQTSDRQTAVALYGLTYFLMSAVYKFLWTYAYKRHLTDSGADDNYLQAIKKIYDIGIVYTLITLIISFLSIPVSLVLYAFMFTIYMMPSTFANKLLQFENRNK